ncbi:hypothetical protein BHE74_00052319 [Ensete ventricosum]|nr:hypothetical protein BHE74_00052319 [Ensete ventricosum]
MRLNRVESFYAFLLRFRSEGSPCKGQPGMAPTPLKGWPTTCKGATGCGQGPYAGGRLATAKAPMQRDSRLRPGPARKGAAPARSRLQGQPPEGSRLQRDSRKGRQPPTDTPGTARKGCRLQGRLLAAVAPAGAVPVEVSAGKGNRHLRRGNISGGSVVRVKEG